MKDTYWGIGLDMKQETICDQSAWKGQNQLGQALMKVRDELKAVLNKYSNTSYIHYDLNLYA